MLRTAQLKKVLILACIPVLAFAPGLVPAAHADDISWLFGIGFNIGSFHFNIGARHVDRYSHRGRYYDSDPWDYYIRVNAPIQYRGYRCSNACYRDGGYYYHHTSCPVVRHHFNRYGYDFDRVLYTYSPHRRYDDRRYDDRRYTPYRGDDRYYDRDRGYRYDDRDDYRDRGYRDRGYRDHGQYRGHGHYHRPGSSCPYDH